MAGGPHAAIVMCMLCGGRAVRVCEGYEDDHYRCEACGEGRLTLFSFDRHFRVVPGLSLYPA